MAVVFVRNREQQLAPEIGFRVARLIRVLNLFRETGETESGTGRTRREEAFTGDFLAAARGLISFWRKIRFG